MTEIIILSLLDKRPMYGAEMVEEIKKISGNTVIMSLPTLYSSLHRMAGKKWVNSYQKQSTIGGRCRVYNITKHGREYLSKNPIQIDYNTIINNDNNILLITENDIYFIKISKYKNKISGKINEEYLYEEVGNKKYKVRNELKTYNNEYKYYKDKIKKDIKKYLVIRNDCNMSLDDKSIKIIHNKNLLFEIDKVDKKYTKNDIDDIYKLL